MRARPRVAVILVNYGEYAARYLPDCYRSLCAQTYPQDRFTLFIVTNGAVPADTLHVARMAPTARLLHNPQNLGWAGGNNTGVRAALEEDFDHLVMLNMDTVVDPDWLSELVNAAEQRPDVHILQSTILLYGTHRINSLGNRIHFLGFGYCQEYGQEGSAGDLPSRLDYASGASMLVKRAVFERIGGFREELFMSCEDLEFCWRARLVGFEVDLASRSVCHHNYAFQHAVDRLFYLHRDRLMTLLTLTRPATVLAILPCLLLGELTLAVHHVAHGRGALPMLVIRHFLSRRTWRSIRAHRREIGRLRKRRDAEIVRQFAGTIRFAEVRHPLLRYLANPLLWLYWTVCRSVIIW